MTILSAVVGRSVRFVLGVMLCVVACENLQAADPFVGLRIQPDRLIAMIEEESPDANKDLKFGMVKGILLAQLQVSEAVLLVYPNEKTMILPVLKIQLPKKKYDAFFGSSESPAAAFVMQDKDGILRVKPEVLTDMKKKDFPLEDYRGVYSGGALWIAPLSLMPAGNTPAVSKEMTSLLDAGKSAEDMAALAVLIPEKLKTGWENKVKDVPGVKGNMQVGMFASLATRILSELGTSLLSIDSMSLSFANKVGVRKITYAQLFREKGGEKIAGALKARKTDAIKAPGILKNIVKLLKRDYIQSKVSYDSKKLCLELGWNKKNDKQAGRELGEATIGYIFRKSFGGGGMKPTQGTIVTSYTNAPEISPALDIEKLKKEMSDIVSKCIFPGHFWARGKTPSMSFEVDMPRFNNSCLAKLEYQVTGAKSPDGTSVFRDDKTKYHQSINLSGTYAGTIRVNVQEGTKPEQLGTATVNFKLTMPSKIEIVEFNASDKPDTKKTSSNVTVTLKQLERDIASVEVDGGTSIHLFACDKTGKAIASSSGSWSSTTASRKFQGVIETLKVVVGKEKVTHDFSLDLAMNKGKPFPVPKEPTGTIPVRFDPQRMPEYVSYSKTDVQDMKVTWQESEKKSWNDGLRLSLNKLPYHGRVSWEVHFFGQNKPAIISGRQSWNKKAAPAFLVKTEDLKKANAAFGKVKLDFSSAITRLVFKKSADNTEITKKLPSGKVFSVTFNKNEIAYKAMGCNILQSMAVDKQVRRLKRVNHTSYRNNIQRHYFWGQPSAFTVDVSESKFVHIHPFEIIKRTVDKKAYASFKTNMDRYARIAEILTTISKKRSRNYRLARFPEGVAGLYYLFDFKGKPARLIDEKVAHSDPLGSKRFGYTATPYQGYTFTLLKGKLQNGKKIPYNLKDKKTTFKWEKGSFDITEFKENPVLAAIPSSKEDPVMIVHWSRIYIKYTDGTVVEYVPQDLRKDGWSEASFISEKQ